MLLCCKVGFIIFFSCVIRIWCFFVVLFLSLLLVVVCSFAAVVIFHSLGFRLVISPVVDD